MSEEQVAATEEMPEEVEEEQEEPTTSEEEETPSEETGEEEEGEQPPPKGRDAESRIKELNWKMKTAQEQADYWRDMFERRSQTKEEPAPVKEEPKSNLPPAPVLPDRFNFDSDEEYHQSVSKYQQDMAQYMNNVLEDRDKRAYAKAQQQQRQQVLSTRQQTLTQKLNTGREKYHDFDTVIHNPSVPIDEAMIEGLTDAENAADVAYYLASNPDEARNISQLSPIQKIMAIGKLDAQMGLKQKQTKAPSPSKPVRGASADSNVDPDKLPIDEWRKLREAGKI